MSVYVREVEKVEMSGPQIRSESIQGARVLVTDEHYKHSLGIVRHLGRAGVQVSLVGTSKESLSCRSRYCRQVFLSKDGKLDSLVCRALEAIRHERFDLVMPVSYPLTLALAQQSSQILPYSHLEIPDCNAILRAANKLEMSLLAERVGVPVPMTVPETKIPTRAGELRFPVVIKQQQEAPGRPPIRYARNLSELETVLDRSSASSSNGTRVHSLVQEFIPGYGCGFFATYQRGVCKRVFMHRRVREYPATGGVSCCAESFYDSKLELYGRRMLDAMNWHGVAMVEFRHDLRDDDYKLMEVNPKFWGSLDLALAAGADFPGDLCQMALGHSLTFSDKYKRNLRFHWPFSNQGDLSHLWTHPRSLFPVVQDFLDPHVKSNVWLKDLSPNVLEVRNLIAKSLRGRKS